MRKLGIAIALLCLSVGTAWAQDDTLSEPPEPPAPDMIAASEPLRPAPPVGSFGTYLGLLPTKGKTIPKGLEPFYVKQEWNRRITDAPVFAFTMVGANVLTWEGTRDKKTHVADYTTLHLRYRYQKPDGFDAEPTRVISGDNTDDGADPPKATLIALDPAKNYFMASHQIGTGKKEWTSVFLGKPGSSGSEVTIPRMPSVELPLALLEYPSHDAPRYLAQSKNGVAILELKPIGETEEMAPLVEPTITKTIPLIVRVPPVSAACVAEFAGDHKQMVAALGSVNNSPVAFVGLRSTVSLPDTEDEFAPGIIAAWNVPGRALPFLVTARNTGAEEGTDNPEGRVNLSLYDAEAKRWRMVWESPPLGKIVRGVTTQAGDGGTSRLFVLYEEADGAARIVCLTPFTVTETKEQP